LFEHSCGKWCVAAKLGEEKKDWRILLKKELNGVCVGGATENLVEDLLGEFEYEVQVPYLLYRNAAQEVNGIWFYNPRECEEVAKLFQRLLGTLLPLCFHSWTLMLSCPKYAITT
jgi:hypothetical protein